MNYTKLRFGLVFVMAAACGDDSRGGSTGTGSGSRGSGSLATVSTIGTSPVADSTGGGSIPPSACANPAMPEPPGGTVSYPDVDRAEIVTVIEPDQSYCPEVGGLFSEITIPAPLTVELHRPSDTEGEWPAGPFPLLVFSHGNGQDGAHYDAMLGDLATRGFMVASVIEDGNSDGEGRASRILCVAEALMTSDLEWTGASRWDGRFGIIGHSNAGLGAFISTAIILDDPSLLAGGELVAVAALAPSRVPADSELLLPPVAPAYFVLQGSGDGDTSGSPPSHYDRLEADVDAGMVLQAPQKVFVWACGVEHSAYGGSMVCATTQKGTALATTYLGGFMAGEFYDPSESWDLFFSTEHPVPLIPPLVAEPSLWSEYDEVPQVFATSSMGVAPGGGSQRYIIDGFENGDVGISDSGLDFSVIDPGLYQEGVIDALFTTTHRASAAIVGWEESNELRWELDDAGRIALVESTSLSFRAGVIVDVEDSVACEGVVGAVPEVSAFVEFQDSTRIDVSLAEHGRLRLPDLQEEFACASLGRSDGCNAWEHMQTTFRLSSAELCTEEYALSDVVALGLRFEGSGDQPRVVVVDDVELRRSPRDPALEDGCRCSPDAVG